MIEKAVIYSKKYFFHVASLLMLVTLVVSCANMASPSGGDYDFDPPKVLRSSPEQKQLNVSKNKIEIIFDELVEVEKPMDKVIVTPPQRNLPLIRAQNNKIIVELKDTLKPNTTYTIDFTDAIVDYNEKNPLGNYALLFSTGNVIDSLSISGKVLSAENLEPITGIYVGIHSDLSDTAFVKVPFLRISRTDERGYFSIKGVAPGKYKIYALDDRNRDYKYDSPMEALAFSEDLIVPSVENAVRYDSIFNVKTFVFDSLKEVGYTKYLPDNVLLKSFTSAFRRQYLQKHERLSDDLLTIYFAAPTAVPEVEALGQLPQLEDWTITEKSIGNDTLKYWITKSDFIEKDSINLRISYNKTDSLNNLVWVSDTLSFVNRKKISKKKEKEKKDEKEKIEFLGVQTNINQEFDIYRDITIQFSCPPVSFGKDRIKLEQEVDSTFIPIDFKFYTDSLNPRRFRIDYDWRYGEDYRFSLDSASVEGYNGLFNDAVVVKFHVKEEDKYGALYLNISGVAENTPAFVELLNNSDKPIFKSEVKRGMAECLYLNPGTYYARLVLDRNGNGKWDTGEYTEKKQPEEVYYYDKTFEIKPFWEIEQDWDIRSLDFDKQKPLEITQNKPKDNEKRRKEMEKRDGKLKKEREERQRQANPDRNMNNNPFNNENRR